MFKLLIEGPTVHRALAQQRSHESCRIVPSKIMRVVSVLELGIGAGRAARQFFFFSGWIGCLLPVTGGTRVPESLSSDKWNALIVRHKPRVAWSLLRGRHCRKRVLATRPVGPRRRARTHLASPVPQRTERLPKRAFGASAPGEGSRQLLCWPLTEWRGGE